MAYVSKAETKNTEHERLEEITKELEPIVQRKEIEHAFNKRPDMHFAIYADKGVYVTIFEEEGELEITVASISEKDAHKMEERLKKWKNIEFKTPEERLIGILKNLIISRIKQYQDYINNYHGDPAAEEMQKEIREYNQATGRNYLYKAHDIKMERIRKK